MSVRGGGEPAAPAAPVQPPGASEPTPDAQAEPATSLGPLDLTLPELDFETEPSQFGTGNGKKFDARPLFRTAEKESKLSLSVTPSFSESENPEEALPEIDGGSVSIEVKTP